VPASRYCITGGPDPTHEWKGVDDFVPIAIPNSNYYWGNTYEVRMYHTGDFVEFHVRTESGLLQVIELALQNLKTPSIGTPVDVFVWRGTGVPAVSHDVAINSDPNWLLIGTVTIYPPGNWQIYPLNVPESVKQALGSRSEYHVAISLQEGEVGPDPETDRNVDVAWLKLRSGAAACPNCVNFDSVSAGTPITNQYQTTGVVFEAAAPIGRTVTLTTTPTAPACSAPNSVWCNDPSTEIQMKATFWVPGTIIARRGETDCASLCVAHWAGTPTTEMLRAYDRNDRVIAETPVIFGSDGMHRVHFRKVGRRASKRVAEE